MRAISKCMQVRSSWVAISTLLALLMVAKQCVLMRVLLGTSKMHNHLANYKHGCHKHACQSVCAHEGSIAQARCRGCVMVVKCLNVGLLDLVLWQQVLRMRLWLGRLSCRPTRYSYALAPGPGTHRATQAGLYKCTTDT
eukprot:scaffold56902_cov19-Tisochrysis_lutea.AAC.3